jgi:ketosteroid isomerase-like protein
LARAIVAQSLRWMVRRRKDKSAMSDPNFADTERDILEIERNTFAAIQNRDIERLKGILAEDFIYRSPGNDELDRAAFLENISTIPVEILSVKGTEQRVSVFGDIAVLTGVQRSTVKLDDGREVVSAVAFTDIFARRDGRWAMVLAYGVEMPETSRG